MQFQEKKSNDMTVGFGFSHLVKRVQWPFILGEKIDLEKVK